ncbi:dihydrolipoamide acetyltransferase family protein [Aliicoccus persicus]|uniref:Dihydrolipoamide acetyltransferase component of pyruvate dehydrogenase complex n=1 Tax=Aliicoccus persicus TaxID=930138 RepID=A0A662Z0Z9_9STAP|nr:dihydrolipoamide acetyltransferase family protein [Aliicoccus persicus]SEV84111.1 branched-chain alpha-keto acid dehydrogenase E2 component [Aliicoccus persicus]
MEEIKMPKLGESVTEGTIEKWLVSPGDTVEEYDPICEVISDKVTAEVPSVFAGTIKELIAQEGDTIEVGGVICTIETEGGSASSETPSVDKKEDVESVAAPTKEAAVEEKSEGASEETKHVTQQVEKPENARISPVVMRLASENNVDLNQVSGTGFEGRITKKDILKFIEEGPKSAPVQEEPKAPETTTTEKAAPTQTASAPSAGEEIPVAGVRKAIAAKMVQSSTEIPHAWLMMEVDATNLVKVRTHHKESFKKKEGFNLTFFSFFVKAVAEAVKEYPIMNSSWQGDKIIVNKDINVSIAVAGDDKLYVPVIKNADDLSIKGVAKQVSELANLGRNHKLTSAHMSGGTITVNNTGAFGSIQSMGIINHPQAAILQVESIVKRPVIIDGMIAQRDMVNLCLSIDHRILDGLVAGNFLKLVKEKIENMSIESSSIY